TLLQSRLIRVAVPDEQRLRSDTLRREPVRTGCPFTDGSTRTPAIDPKSPACLGTAVLGNGRAFECNGTTRTRHGPALEVGRSGGVESSTGLRGRGGGRPNRHLSARVPILHGTRLVTAPARL